MPLVYSEDPVGGDSNDGRVCEAWLRVGGHMGNGRVRWELEHHDDVLLHLLCEHQWGLQKEILLSPSSPSAGSRETQRKKERWWEEEKEKRGREAGKEEIRQRKKEECGKVEKLKEKLEVIGWVLPSTQ